MIHVLLPSEVMAEHAQLVATAVRTLQLCGASLVILFTARRLPWRVMPRLVEGESGGSAGGTPLPRGGRLR